MGVARSIRMESSPHKVPGQQELRAQENVRIAEEKANQQGFLCFNTTQYKQEAAELFHQAGVDYKVASIFDQSGKTFMRCAEMHSILNNPVDEGSAYVEAAQVYKQCDSAAAIDAFHLAAEMAMNKNRINQAAKFLKEIGELHEKEFQWEEAAQNLKKAAEFFHMEGQNSSQTSCLLKVAQFQAQYLSTADSTAWTSAIAIYEKEGKKATNNNLLKYSAKKYFFAAGLCRLAADQPVHNLTDALNEYRVQDVSFGQQRENDLLEHLVQAVEEKDAGLFQQKLSAYDNFTKLDSFQTAICLRIRRNIETVDLDAETGGVVDTPTADPNVDLN